MKNINFLKLSASLAILALAGCGSKGSSNSQAVAETAQIDATHVPSECPVGIEGEYTSETRDGKKLILAIRRDENNDLTLAYRQASSKQKDKNNKDKENSKNTVIVNGVKQINEKFSVEAYCRGSAIYYAMTSNDGLESETTRLTVVDNGLKVEGISPADDAVIYPRLIHAKK